MVWNIVAFQDYNVRRGILGSSWIGLENFKRFFESPYAFRLIRNTFLLSFMDLLMGFPVPILFALLLNEVKKNWVEEDGTDLFLSATFYFGSSSGWYDENFSISYGWDC